MERQTDLFRRDITANRHGGSPESRDAFERIRHEIPDARLRVLMEIQARPLGGMTCKELAAFWDVDMNVVSGRFSELKRDGMIRRLYDNGDPVRRENCGVYVAGQAVDENDQAGGQQ